MNDFTLFDILKLLVRQVFSNGLTGTGPARVQAVRRVAPQGSMWGVDGERVVDVSVQEPAGPTPLPVGFPMTDRNGLAWLQDDGSPSCAPFL